MDKRYFYEFSGRILLNADNEDQAEDLIADINLDDYLTDEDVFEVDDEYIPLDPKRREQKLGTALHPSDVDRFQNFKMNKLRYSAIFDDFMHGKFDKGELMKKISKAEKSDIQDIGYDYEISMIDLDTREGKRAKVAVVD